MRYRNGFTVLMLFLMMQGQAASAESRRIWDEKPLSILLPVGKEVRVTFPTDVQVQVPLGISEKLTSLAPTPRMIYWTASEEFSPARVIATANDGRTVYVVDIAAQKEALKDDIMIEDPARVPTQDTRAPLTQSNENDSTDGEELLEDPAEILLTRYAAQTLYAPSRLIPIDPRIGPVHYLTIGRDFPLLQSSQGEQVSVEVVGSWTGFGRFVTAVLVKNSSAIGFVFDASRVRGNFTHITAQHLTVGPKGTLTDRTTLYLVSHMPFAEALSEDSYAY